MAPDDDVSTVDEGSAARCDSAPPQLTGRRYRLGDPIGHGGMGEVFAAHDEQIGRDVAIKRVRSNAPSDRQIHRFIREAQIQGRLVHPAIVPVYDLGRDVDGLPYFAMKRLTGTTLAKILETGDHARFGNHGLLRAFVDVCLAIEYAHVNGVVHRDLKPANIILGDFGEVYVLDWGIAKVVGEVDDTFDDIRGDETATSAGSAIGTPAYMAPEQATGELDIDARADVYALGRVLEETLGMDRPPELAMLCTHATAPERTARLASARALGEGVQRFLDGDRDLELRQRLAREHFDLAIAAFGDRRTAMREASRALALDPKLSGVAELVGRLMLEPPSETPVEVDRAIASEDATARRAHARAALRGHLGYFVLAPSLIVAGSISLAIVVGTIIALSAAFAAHDVRAQRGLAPWLVIAVNAVVIAMLTRLVSPLILAPTIATLVGLALSLEPAFGRPRHVALIAVSLLGAIVVPRIAELAGVIPQTIDVTAAGLFVHAPGLVGNVVLTNVLVGLHAITVVAAAVVIGRSVRSSERASKRQLHLQAWQLRQLIPDEV